MSYHKLHRWMRSHTLVKFLLLLTGAVSAHLLAAAAFEMARYYFVEGWTGINWHDVVIVTVALIILAATKLLMKPVKLQEFAPAVLAFVAFQWLAFAIHHSLERNAARPLDLAMMGGSAAVVLALFAYFRIEGRAKLAVVETRESSAVKCLILFLSLAKSGAPPRPPQEKQGDPHSTQWQDMQTEISAMGTRLDDSESWKAFGGHNWRMPISAIGHQFLNGNRSLQKVLVIASKESVRQFDFFRQTVDRLCAPLALQRSLVVELVERDGIDISDCQEISRTVDKAKRQAVEERLAPFLVDVTGGNALCSLVGAALTMDEDEAFQYVSTIDSLVRSYDIVYRPRHEAVHEV